MVAIELVLLLIPVLVGGGVVTWKASQKLGRKIDVAMRTKPTLNPLVAFNMWKERQTNRFRIRNRRNKGMKSIGKRIKKDVKKLGLKKNHTKKLKSKFKDVIKHAKNVKFEDINKPLEDLLDLISSLEAIEENHVYRITELLEGLKGSLIDEQSITQKLSELINQQQTQEVNQNSNPFREQVIFILNRAQQFTKEQLEDLHELNNILHQVRNDERMEFLISKKLTIDDVFKNILDAIESKQEKVNREKSNKDNTEKQEVIDALHNLTAIVTEAGNLAQSGMSNIYSEIRALNVLFSEEENFVSKMFQDFTEKRKFLNSISSWDPFSAYNRYCKYYSSCSNQVDMYLNHFVGIENIFFQLVQTITKITVPIIKIFDNLNKINSKKYKYIPLQIKIKGFKKQIKKTDRVQETANLEIRTVRGVLIGLRKMPKLVLYNLPKNVLLGGGKRIGSEINKLRENTNNSATQGKNIETIKISFGEKNISIDKIDFTQLEEDEAKKIMKILEKIKNTDGGIPNNELEDLLKGLRSE
ncbi:MAG: hypothetical protein GON13_00785 [Nanoarchaeota archaeon]|nr:hypothetical protein [Nanoarchaeota archaeon]